MYLSYHSYGEKIVYPWSFQPDPVEDWRDLHGMATVMAGAMERASGHHTRFKVGLPASYNLFQSTATVARKPFSRIDKAKSFVRRRSISDDVVRFRKRKIFYF